MASAFRARRALRAVALLPALLLLTAGGTHAATIVVDSDLSGTTLRPEPGPLLLLAAGLGGLVAFGRQRDDGDSIRQG